MTKLLVVDDDPDMLDLVKAVLEAYHFTVELASNGQEALDRVKAARPDGIFLGFFAPTPLMPSMT